MRTKLSLWRHVRIFGMFFSAMWAGYTSWLKALDRMNPDDTFTAHIVVNVTFNPPDKE